MIRQPSSKERRPWSSPPPPSACQSVNLITPQLHQAPQCRDKGWYHLSLPEQKGDSRFHCFNRCQEVFFTRSRYYGDEALCSKVHYADSMTLMVFGLKGRSYFGLTEDDVTHAVSAGDIWLFNLKQQDLYRYSQPLLNHEMAVIKFPTRRLQQAFSSKDQRLLAILDKQFCPIATQQDNQQWIAPLVDNPLRTPFDRIKAESRVLELLAHWLLPLGQSVVADQSEDPLSVDTCCPVERAREILVAQLVSPPSLQTLSKLVGMSHTRLNRDFKKKYGKTVFDWLRGYRLQLAKTYLADKQQTITAIAYLCGFSSASHFTQTFRHYEGCTPLTYRTEHLSQESDHDA